MMPSSSLFHLTLLLLIAACFLLELDAVVAVDDPVEVEIEATPSLPKNSRTKQKQNKQQKSAPVEPPPKGLTPDQLTPDMIRELKKTIPGMKFADGAQLPGDGKIDFQQMILEQLEKEERKKTGKGEGEEEQQEGGGDRSSTPHQPPSPPPVGTKRSELKLLISELSLYNGSDSSLPLYLSIKNKIFDVSSGVEFYGSSAPYNYVTGKEIARALATFCYESTGLTADLRGLTEEQLSKITEWSQFYTKKYPVVGWVRGSKIKQTDPIPDDHCKEAHLYTDRPQV